MRTRRIFHLYELVVLTCFATALPSQAPITSASSLYALAATPTENISYGTNRYPAVLYRVTPAKKLGLVREIVSEKDGSAAVLDGTDAIFVVDPLNFTVAVIHKSEP